MTEQLFDAYLKLWRSMSEPQRQRLRNGDRRVRFSDFSVTVVDLDGIPIAAPLATDEILSLPFSTDELDAGRRDDGDDAA